MPCRRHEVGLKPNLQCSLARAGVAWRERGVDLPNLEAFVDGVVGSFMSQQQIAGVQVAVVRDGETLLVKGYGIDSVEPRRVVDPQQSLFRLGSISKTFTWLSIMQLAERGQLKLDDPVNDHLPDALDVPDEGFEQPIRIVDLMNHTAGFEDIAAGSVRRARTRQLLPLHEQLRKRRPHRVREPGKLMAYSNYSTALAGAIVAQVSGMEYESYVEQNILAPLGLTHTTFREQYPPTQGLPQPMSAELAAHLAQNIEMRNGAVADDPARAHRFDGARRRSGFDRRGHGALHARVARPAATRSSGRARGRRRLRSCASRRSRARRACPRSTTAFSMRRSA